MGKLVLSPMSTGIAAIADVSWRAAAALAWREIVRFFRQPNRIVGSIGTPLVFWLLFGAGLSSSFRIGSESNQQNFLTYFFPGSLLLIVLFTAIFSSISIIEDRREGFLQAVLVAPIPRWSMVLGKVLGGTLIALVQGLIFLLLGLTLPIELTPLAAIELVAFLFVASLTLTSLGTVFAWKTDSSQGFHAIMNLVLMPLWLLSGAFFPIPAAAGGSSWSQQALHIAMRLNPVSYAVGGVRRLLAPAAEYPQSWVPDLTTSWLVTAAFAAVSFGLAVWISRQRTAGDLQ
jgi:ABC-2 type transport system permease protein